MTATLRRHFTHCPDEEGTEIATPPAARAQDGLEMNFTHCPDEEGTEIISALRISVQPD